MSYQLEITEPIDVGVRRIANELIDDAIVRIEAPDRNCHEAVHEVRKNCKKLRALLRLIRPRVPDLYKAENRHFRDAAASLSGIRDAEAALESYDALLKAFDGGVDRCGLAPARRVLTLHKQHLAEEMADLDARLDAFGERMHEARKRVSDWQLPADDPNHGKRGFGLLEAGLAKTYKRGRKAMDRAYEAPSVENFHEWRKRAKYQRYHLRLLRPVWPRLLKRTRSEVKTLGDLLGEDHDLAVLEEVLTVALGADVSQGRMDVLKALMRQRSLQLRDEALWLGRRSYAEKPKAFRK
ncbi:MAG TPA: CHAD domain-containing protein, partial [Thioalkalivibrio sp.]|nr:CHAD domain-containing protein [Thioalkalivibrio sp.]